MSVCVWVVLAPIIEREGEPAPYQQANWAYQFCINCNCLCWARTLSQLIHQPQLNQAWFHSELPSRNISWRRGGVVPAQPDVIGHEFEGENHCFILYYILVYFFCALLECKWIKKKTTLKKSKETRLQLLFLLLLLGVPFPSWSSYSFSRLALCTWAATAT